MKLLIMGDLPLNRLEGLSHFANGSGNSTWLESLFPHFGSMPDCDVHWLVLSKSVNRYRVIPHSGQTLHVLPRWKKSVSMLTLYAQEISLIRRTVHKIAPDIIHAWGSEDVYGLAGSRMHRPAVFTLQGCLNDYLKKTGGKFLFRIQARYEKMAVSSYDYGTAESPLALNQLLSLNSTISHKVVDYGVNECFHRAKWDPDRSPTLFFAGAINERKGIRDLIQAFSMVNNPDVKLRIAGAGPLYNILKSVSDSRIHWLGKISGTDICRELERCWAFVMPTHADTGPTAVKEARVVGCPVITTHDAGAKCYIESGKNGYIVEAKRLELLAESMEKITASRKTTISMGNHNHAQTAEALHPSETIRKFNEIYLKIKAGQQLN